MEVSEKELKSIEEVNELIAMRVPPGDRWKLTTPEGTPTTNNIIDGIVETMSVYMRENNYYGDYRLAPLDNGGRIYVLKKVEVVIDKPPPKKYDLYGEH